jgi:hypothetical protein
MADQRGHCDYGRAPEYGRISTGCRCNSTAIIVSSHCSRLAVMVSTTRSRSSPSKPLAA